jgi:hypothetical protein
VTQGKDIDEDDVIDLQPLKERPWEKDARAGTEEKEEGKGKREKKKTADDATELEAEVSTPDGSGSTEPPTDSKTKDTPPSPAA